jgi:hypothetical protein
MLISLTSTDTTVNDLVRLNLALQLFDGIATYQGLRLGWSEGNPLLVVGFAYLGAGPTLLIAKLNACALLLLLHRLSHHALVPPVLAFLALAYGAFSFLPWLLKFGGLLATAVSW